ncbi:MAG: hypothetical protein GX640_12025 [Fibrobacter sp.]|nr:hypothetical protein [Fibrobacter sp.]
MQSIVIKVVNRIYWHGRGWAFTPKDFVDIGERASIDTSLNRLQLKGTIRNILRGVYDYPRFSSLFNAPASPEPDQIAQAIARNHGWSISPSGETALNILGLSNQVPGKYLYFSDGPTKKYSWAGGELCFTKRAIKETAALSPRTVLLVQALKTLGNEHITTEIICKLSKQFTKKEKTTALREAKYVTNWVYETIKKITQEQEIYV